jgi:hypothetical protein
MLQSLQRRRAQPKLNATRAARFFSIPESTPDDLRLAFEVCEKEIISGVQRVDPRAIDSFACIFFHRVWEIPFFQIPIFLLRIFKIQVHLALYLYPTYQPDFFTRPDGILSSDAGRLSGFVSALSRGFNEPAFLSPVVCYHFPAIQSAMLADDSQRCIFLSLANRVSDFHPGILQALSQAVKWLDRGILLNFGLFDKLRCVLDADQSSLCVKELFLACAAVFGDDCAPLLAAVENLDWVSELAQQPGMSHFAGRAAEIKATHRDAIDAAAIAAVEQFIADPLDGAVLAAAWGRASAECRERCANLAATALGTFLDDVNPCLTTFTALLSHILTVFVADSSDDGVLGLVEMPDYRVNRFCRYLLMLTEAEGGLPPVQWLKCLRTVVRVCVSENFEVTTDEAVRAVVLSGRLLGIAFSSFGESIDSEDEEVQEATRMTLCRMSALMVRGYAHYNIEDAFLDLARESARFVRPCPEIDCILLRVAERSPEKWGALAEIAWAGYTPAEPEKLLSIVVESRSREYLLQIFRLMAGLYRRGPLLPIPHKVVDEPPFSVEKAMDFFECLKVEGLITPETVSEFVEAAVSVTGEDGMASWLLEARVATLKPTIIQRILSFRPPIELADHFFPLLWELQQKDQLRIDRADIFVAILESARHLGMTLSAPLRRRLVHALPALFDGLLNRPIVVHPYGNYDRQPSFSALYGAIEVLCEPGDLEMFIERMAVRYRQLFVLIFLGYGYFGYGWECWREFLDFHRFLQQRIGVEIPFPGKLPPEFAEMPAIYHNCLVFDGQPREIEMKRLEKMLGAFEFYVHVHELKDDSTFP